VILAIESSCDDSALALVSIADNKIVFEARLSQSKAHTRYGGVVPELAARLHAKNLPKLLTRALPFAKAIKAIAVTNCPGLTVALAEGVVMAQALSLALDAPILPIHHIKGHLMSLFIDKEAAFPLSALMVSGGHTMILEARSHACAQEVGATLDDAIGEAFDKVAKMLNLGYPGGALVENLASGGDENRFDFPLPLRGDKRIAFSFSGLKNSVRLAVMSRDDADERFKADLCASFQKAAVNHLLDKAALYLNSGVEIRRFGLIGGVSANGYLRRKFGDLCAANGIEPLFAPLEFSGDNAAMIARAAIEAFKVKEFCDAGAIKIYSRRRLECLS
jgi:N6-L-threonylcarbamoyladenine synthase